MCCTSKALESKFKFLELPNNQHFKIKDPSFALHGTLPASLGKLTNLVTLNLGGSDWLTGPIPAELGRLTALVQLDLFGNKLSGSIPAALGQLGALTELWLGENELSGAIPAELGQLGALNYLYLYGNQLTGQEAFGAYMEEHHPDCHLEI